MLAVVWFLVRQSAVHDGGDVVAGDEGHFAGLGGGADAVLVADC